jgi:hypothetical protein
MILRLELFTNNPRTSVDFYTSVLRLKDLESYPEYYHIQRGCVIIGISLISGLPEGHYFRPEISKVMT